MPFDTNQLWRAASSCRFYEARSRLAIASDRGQINDARKRAGAAGRRSVIWPVPAPTLCAETGWPFEVNNVVGFHVYLWAFSTLSSIARALGHASP